MPAWLCGVMVAWLAVWPVRSCHLRCFEDEGRRANVRNVNSRPKSEARTIPISIHGDGLPISGVGKSWQASAEAFSWCSMLSRGSTLATNFLIHFVYKTLTVKGGTHQTMEQIWRLICWSLDSLARGLWPEMDPHGQAWPQGSPDARRAGTALAGGWCGILWCIRGDLEHFSGCYNLENSNSNSPCCLCQCDRADTPWSDFRREGAAWQATTWRHEQWVAARPDRHQVFKLQGVGVEAICPDLMHTWYLGVLQYFLGSLFAYLVRERFRGAEDAAVERLWAALNAEYQAGSQRLSHLRASMFMGAAGEFPRLKCKAGEVIGLCSASHRVCEAQLRRADRDERMMQLAMDAVMAIEAIVHDRKADFVWPPAVADQWLDLVFRFLQLQSALASSFQLRGMFLFHVTIKSHYLIHIAQRARHLNPCRSWCFSGEDMMGRVKHLVAAAYRGAGPPQVVSKVLRKYTKGLAYGVLGDDIWRAA